MRPGERIETVEFVSAGEGQSRSTNFDVVLRTPGGPQPAREVTVSVLVARPRDAVDAGRPLESDCTRQTRIAGDDRSRSAGSNEAERPCLGVRGIAWAFIQTI